MSAFELRAALGLAAIVFLRMFGLFMLLPVLALHLQDYPGATPMLIGVAVGGYGISQAALQIPFGALSDRVGRKPVIAAGLLIFSAGSLFAGHSVSIGGVIAGRILQGAGAVAAASMALAADLSRDEHRTKFMAILGISIGTAFLVGILAGPVLDVALGISGLFFVAAGLALSALFCLLAIVPNPGRKLRHADCETSLELAGSVLRRPQLLRLDFGVFCLHLNITALFVVLPVMLRDGYAIASQDHWRIYAPVLIASVAFMLPLVRRVDLPGYTKPIYLSMILTLALAQAMISLHPATITTLAALLVVFFVAFNVLEATLPALVSRVAPLAAKGTALGMFSTSQFCGAFVGGIAGGYLYQAFGSDSVFVLCSLSAAAWLVIAGPMQEPKRLQNRILGVGKLSASEIDRIREQLTQMHGMEEAIVNADEGVAYLRFDPEHIDAAALARFEAAAEPR